MTHRGYVVRTRIKHRCEKGGGGECTAQVAIVIGMGYDPIWLCEKCGREQLKSMGIPVPQPDLITWHSETK